MQTDKYTDYITLRRCSDREQANTYALVLIAKGIASITIADGQGFNLLVAPMDAVQASYELTAYDAENKPSTVKKRPLRLVPPSFELLLAYWVSLVFFFGATGRKTFSVPWDEIGAGQAGLIRAGEWWRVVTALFLHVDGAHLLSNLAFGTLFLLLLSQILGPGMTALSVLAAGAAGNLLNALVRPAEHTSIGASTMVFAAVGLLAAMKMDWRTGRVSRSLRDWVPIAAGIMLLAFLGFGEGQTDILAHVFGFAAGICLGAALAWQDRAWSAEPRLQAKAAFTATATVVLAWTCALLAG